MNRALRLTDAAAFLFLTLLAGALGAMLVILSHGGVLSPVLVVGIFVLLGVVIVIGGALAVLAAAAKAREDDDDDAELSRLDRMDGGGTR